MRLVGFRDGFRGLMQNRIEWLGPDELSGILTLGGTILGTSRDKPHKMPIGGKTRNMMDVMVENYHRHHLDALGLPWRRRHDQERVSSIAKQGINVVCLPKTIDNDVSGTDVTFGYRYRPEYRHRSARPPALDGPQPPPHHRLSRSWATTPAGWRWGRGLAGGADVILIPEIPFPTSKRSPTPYASRSRGGKRFSIVAVSEGAMTQRVGEKLLSEARATPGGRGRRYRRH